MTIADFMDQHQVWTLIYLMTFNGLFVLNKTINYCKKG